VLTQLLNLRLFRDRLEQEIKIVGRAGSALALIAESTRRARIGRPRRKTFSDGVKAIFVNSAGENVAGLLYDSDLTVETGRTGGRHGLTHGMGRAL
jgi:D-Tyr-tRNAtyr deacylase